MGQRTLIPSCRDLAASVSSGEFEEARGLRRLLLRLHLVVCWICRRYAAQIRFLGAAARQSRDLRVAEVEQGGLKARLLARLVPKEEGK